MYLEIYIDVVFMVNFIMDFIILVLERMISKKNVSIYKIFLGALTGAILMCITILIPKFNYIVYLGVGYFFSSMIIVWITFSPKDIKELIKLTLLLYIIAVVLGGIIFALYYYTSVGYGVHQLLNNEIINGIDLGLFIILLFFAIVIFTIFIRLFIKISSISKNIYSIKIRLKNKEIVTHALLDTGNNLYDPITNFPVIIGEVELLKNLFTEEQYIKIRDLLSNLYDIEKFEEVRKKYGLNIRLIPYSSLGNENGMLIGIVLDQVIVQPGSKEKIHKNIVIGVYNKKLSKDNSYQLLLHPKLV